MTHNRFADRLRPAEAVLVVLDAAAIPSEKVGGAAGRELHNNLIGLARLARACSLPAALCLEEAGATAAILPELAELFGTETVLRRRGLLFDDPQAGDAIHILGRHHLLLAGLADAEIFAEVALAAVQLGFEVHAVVDASLIGAGPAGHVWIASMTAAGIHITTWIAVLAELAAPEENLEGCDPAQAGIIAAVGDCLAHYVWPGSNVWNGAQAAGFQTPALSEI